jgi:hypothetical protein
LNFGGSAFSTLEGGPPLTLHVKGSVVFLSSVRVIVTTHTITGNGKLCTLICLEVLGMTHLFPGSSSYARMESWPRERPNFVDDIHPVIREKDNDPKACQTCAQLKSRMNSVGNQADDRKYRLPTTTPGAWNGVITHTDTPKDGLSWI